MILGYVDAKDRVYDLRFATMKLKVRVESATGEARVLFSDAAGEGEVSYRVLGEADVTASVAMDYDGHQVPLLRPVAGHLSRHEGGLLFVAAPRTRDPGDPSFYLANVRAMPSALDFFFEDQEGTEMVSIPRDEVLRVMKGDRTTTVYVSAANVALPKEKIAYAVELSPAVRVESLLADVALSR